RAVRLPSQNSAKAKKLGGGSTARKSPIGSTNNQWGIIKPPLIKVSLYFNILVGNTGVCQLEQLNLGKLQKKQ
ncbi:hypothetical protein P4420_23715, partial [Bacillus thuringiensis]|nr:hypothetical protein [Bacillus thuringiensis]